jgi:hypothetical protein
MKVIQLLKRSCRPVFRMRRGVYPALLSVLCTVCASCIALQARAQKGVQVVCIQPFQLEQPCKFEWRLERPSVSSGTLVVIKVDTSLVRPKNSLEPVLYAGNHTVQRLNQGHESGYVIGIIPGQVDFTKEPVWFGDPALPERISATIIENELARAKLAGIALMKAADVQSLTRAKAAAGYLNDLLRNQAGDLILEFSKQDKYVVDAWRLPQAGQ